MEKALPRFDCGSISQLQHRVLHDPAAFPELLSDLTVQVSDLFRDPPYFRAFRGEVVPFLRTHAAIRLWVAGVATGEELYSFAIVLHEGGLLDRTTLYATDISPEALRLAQAGVYRADRLARFEENYREAGGAHALGDYYGQAYGGLVFRRWLTRGAVFADHSLATDAVFAEVQMVSCRNVLIYFDRALQERAVGLFAEALSPRGYLGLGTRESLRFTGQAEAFAEVGRGLRLYRKV